VYRTGPGTIFRVSETVEGGLKVEVLKGDMWIPGRIALVGLRLSSTTRTLGPGDIAALPA